MAKNNTNTKQGFTIIEVVLVLAIAGLIFLMVFVALPALQRSQRDTARRNDMSRVDTSLVQYQTNNSTKSNNLPGAGSWKGKADFKDGNNCSSTDTACLFVRDYMNSGAAEMEKANEFEDPEGTPYSVLITDNWAKVSDGGSGTLGVITFNENSKLVEKEGGYTIEGNNPFSEHVVYIVPGGRCEGEVVKQSQKRHFAVLYRLEGAGVYCIDDQ
jgi:prepilin-type N-terminal cleavage/methylation domain-containing protein